MPAPETLLSHIARRHAMWREDVATDALSFILTHSTPARAAFADFLSYGASDTPALATVQTQYTISASGGAPDLAGLDNDGKLLALVESKFWAGLTANQPVTYWNALPTDTPATLLFLAPAHRIDPGGLWYELAERLTKAGHPLSDPVRQSDYTMIAPAQDSSQRRLMVTSWRTLLDHLQQSALAQSDWQALFEIGQLQGLATSVISGADPRRDDNLKNLVTRAVRQLVQAGWANTDGYGVGVGHKFWVRGLTFAGVNSWFGIHYGEAERSGRLLWLACKFGETTAARMHDRLAALPLDESVEWETRFDRLSAHITIPPGADHESALNSIVAQLIQIAQLIDPNGPTYKDAPNA